MTLQLKSSHKAVKEYYSETDRLSDIGMISEGTVSSAFAALLRHCAAQVSWTLNEKVSVKRGKKTIIPDGIFLNDFNLYQGAWEAKDSHDKLDIEVRRKFADGYPRDNIIFQSPDQIIIWQNSREVFNQKISEPENLIRALEIFFSYQPPAYKQWEEAAEKFREQMPGIGSRILDLIDKEYRDNNAFVQAMNVFTNLCRDSINPNIAPAAVKEMLIQHLLTERIFRKVFDNPDFASKNTIAVEIEKVIAALTSQHFSRTEFLTPLDHFYKAIEITASTIENYTEKQSFLNTVYEKFFQGFAVKAADTHGIVYTPQPVVDFMVKSVEDILQKEFGRSLSDKGVHILDPFVGTGNFITRIMREIRKTALPEKYGYIEDKKIEKGELHCNEVLLLPYYIAATNIEHEYYEITGKYRPFDGICLVDTFELAEDKQMSVFTAKNTERVSVQKETQIFVIIGNPPYNAGQVNENDNNKNRKYETMDRLVAESYGKDSKAALLRKLNDPYVKAIKWASERIKKNGEGIVAFITNNSFVNEITFDGMRKHLSQEFDKIYILDLGGNVRKNPRLSGTTHNVFGIQVGVSINIFVKKRKETDQVKLSVSEIRYARADEFWRKEDKYQFLKEKGNISAIEWKLIVPDEKHNWLTEGLQSEFETFLPIGSKTAKRGDTQAIFHTYSLGVSTNRDSVVYDFDRQALESRIEQFCDNYNIETLRYHQKGKPEDIDNFVNYEKIQWSSTLKNHTHRGTPVQFDNNNIRTAIYRPFTEMLLYYDNILNDRPAHFKEIFTNLKTESENLVICVNQTSEKPFCCLITNKIPNLVMCGGFGAATQCFPFYIYNEDGTNRKENITDWALSEYRSHYKDASISKWDVFYYIYGLLHCPQYREKYAANLKRELPRIPFAPDFGVFADAGRKLANLHISYENQPEYPLKQIESPDEKLNWRVEKMRLSKDKTEIIYNNFLTLSGIPKETYQYRLGNRSALEWITDQYQVKTDKRSGIVNDPNRADDPQYIIRLIGKVTTVSIETVKIVKGLPESE